MSFIEWVEQYLDKEAVMKRDCYILRTRQGRFIYSFNSQLLQRMRTALGCRGSVIEVDLEQLLESGFFLGEGNHAN